MSSALADRLPTTDHEQSPIALFLNANNENRPHHLFIQQLFIEHMPATKQKMLCLRGYK